MSANRPRVAIFNTLSVDGRLDGFEADLGLFYGIAAAMPQQAILTGSATLEAAAVAEGVDLSQTEESASAVPSTQQETRPWLVIVDSGGKITRFAWLRAQPYWRDVVVLCSNATPTGHLERLRRLGVVHHVLGTDRVDLAAALTLLHDTYGVRDVRVDAGPGLNGALMRAGLVDRISVLVAPVVVGEGGRGLRLIGGELGPGRPTLKALAARDLQGGYRLLEYDVLA